METGVSKGQLISSLVGITVVLGGIYALFAYFGITNVQETIQHAGIWAPLVLVLAKASTIIIAPLSGSPIYPLAGALFGFWEGTALLMAGDILGGIVAFYISRFFGRTVVEKMIGGDEKFLSRALRMMGSTKDSSLRGSALRRCLKRLPTAPGSPELISLFLLASTRSSASCRLCSLRAPAHCLHSARGGCCRSHSRSALWLSRSGSSYSARCFLSGRRSSKIPTHHLPL